MRGANRACRTETEDRDKRVRVCVHFCEGHAYSSWRLCSELGTRGVTGVWDTDFNCLKTLAAEP